ncbi:photosystem II protein Y [Prochlorococcus sp. MIT 1307]|nr:photosystem II protein Y [Prochlorococcus sp. MIT 1307]
MIDFRLLIVLAPIVASVAWTAFWLFRWGVFNLDNVPALLKGD